MDKRAIAVYADLMVEVKYRIEAISETLKGELPFRPKIAEEFCFLQLRMICELIAIGSLIAHGDLSSKKADLMKSYKADLIMKKMTELHPKFYPQPLESGTKEWIYKKDGFLRKEELIQLYNRHAGATLHRGSAKNILEKQRPLKTKEVAAWRDKIITLLNKHIMFSPDKKTALCVIMQTEDGNVQTTIWEQDAA